MLSPDYQARDKYEANSAIRFIKFTIAQKHGVEFGNIPTTVEGKKTYNEAVREALRDPRVVKLASEWGGASSIASASSLNKVEGTDWWISDGAEALIDHDILGKYESGKATSEYSQNDYGRIEQNINEYGFRTVLPGKYQNLLYQTSVFVDPNTGESKRTTLPELGGKSYEPVIQYEDALGLSGMGLENRRYFLDQVQGILDQVAPGMDVRQLRFKTGYDGKSVELDISENSMNNIKSTIEKKINQNLTLVTMKTNADKSGNKSFGELTISVLDTKGNELPKDQVRLSAGGKSAIVSVAQIMEMDQMQMLTLVGA